MKERKGGHKTKRGCKVCKQCFACCGTNHTLGRYLSIRRTVGHALDHVRDQPTSYTELQAKYDAVGILLWALHEVVADSTKGKE
jgi:hypothetical protein